MQGLFYVFSTYVEMILGSREASKMTAGVLHVCGDDPKPVLIWFVGSVCSPRMWR